VSLLTKSLPPSLSKQRIHTPMYVLNSGKEGIFELLRFSLKSRAEVATRVDPSPERGLPGDGVAGSDILTTSRAGPGEASHA